MNKYALAALLLSTTSAMAQAQTFVSTTYLECMEKAGNDYKREWKYQCHKDPEVKTRDEDNCPLPILVVRELNSILKGRRDVCSQAQSAGVLR
jgi:hypothetical protein